MSNLHKNNENSTLAKTIERAFPELVESEDEKMRKSLIRAFSHYNPDTMFGEYASKDIVSWLEKQKIFTDEENEQGKSDVLWCINQAKKHAKDENEMGMCWFAEKWLEKQKPSDEALKYIKENHSPSEVSDFQAAMNIAVAKAFDAGKKAQKLVEWSEEDEHNLQFIGNEFFKIMKYNDWEVFIVWLKSLKERIKK